MKMGPLTKEYSDSPKHRLANCSIAGQPSVVTELSKICTAPATMGGGKKSDSIRLWRPFAFLQNGRRIKAWLSFMFCTSLNLVQLASQAIFAKSRPSPPTSCQFPQIRDQSFPPSLKYVQVQYSLMVWLVLLLPVFPLLHMDHILHVCSLQEKKVYSHTDRHQQGDSPSIA